MNDMFQCGDHEALVAYLYDEGDRADRQLIGAHLAQCDACAEEMAALGATRTQLAAWAPPDARLGFQITSADQRSEPLAFTAVDRAPRSWWREPLPAWAQAAAAALIFAAGLTAGTLGRASAPNAVATAPAAAPVVDRAAQTVTAPVSTELARLEQRLRALESARVQNVSAPAALATSTPRGLDEQALLTRVNQLIAESEERQRQEVDYLAGQFEAQRVADLQRVAENLGAIRTGTGEEFRRRDAMEPMRRISFQPPVPGR